MAKTPKKAKASAPQKAAESPKTAAARPEPAGRTLALRPAAPATLTSPFGIMRRFSEEVDRLFDDFRTSLFPRLDFSKADTAWAPPVEVSEKGGQLIIRAELPGLAKKDVRVAVREDALTIEGERRQEREEKRKGFYRSERSYGSFFRQIPLPEGIDPANAKASFKDGVLQVTMPAPPKPAKGRAIPIEES
jgi:HSP20 family protein